MGMLIVTVVLYSSGIFLWGYRSGLKKAVKDMEKGMREQKRNE